ncbi:hypothetical protein Tco_1025304, partial [Tanacetum coccineum]
MEMIFGLGKKMLLGLVLEASNGKFDVARQIWCCQANFGAVRQKFVLLVTVTTVASMANLEFVGQHNMVACLEKTERNSDFHEIVDFLASSLIHHALTIDATVDSKAVVVTEASIRSSLLFNDADGTACLTNEAIFQNLALMGYEAQNLPARMSFLQILLQLLSVWPLIKSLTFLNLFLMGRKKSKPESTLDDSTVFDDQDVNHGMEYMETEEVVDKGRYSGETEEVKLTDDTEVVEDKGSGDKGGNAEELASTARPEVSTARPDIDAASAVEPRTPPTTTSIFDDEGITMAQTLIKMKEEKAKEKGVSIKDIDDSSRPARSILTLKPLPTIDP